MPVMPALHTRLFMGVRNCFVDLYNYTFRLQKNQNNQDSFRLLHVSKSKLKKHFFFFSRVLLKFVEVPGVLGNLGWLSLESRTAHDPQTRPLKLFF
jgi:hypothetical protein